MQRLQENARFVRGRGVDGWCAVGTVDSAARAGARSAQGFGVGSVRVPHGGRMVVEAGGGRAGAGSRLTCYRNDA